MRTALAIVVASLALALAGCSSTITPEGAAKSITPEGAAKSVVDLVKEQTGFEPKDVKCPDGVEAKEGTTFECKFTGPEGKEYTADMRITKVEGDDVEFYIETKPS